MGMLIKKKLSKALTYNDDEERGCFVSNDEVEERNKLNERLKELQKRANTCVRQVKLPTMEEYGSEESELALLRYCYYRIIYQVAGTIIERPDNDIYELIDKLLSLPMGSSVTKADVLSLCNLFMTTKLKSYRIFRFFENWSRGHKVQWSTDDVAGSIRGSQGGFKQLLEAALADYDKNFKD